MDSDHETATVILSLSHDGELYECLMNKDEDRVIELCLEYPEGPFRVLTPNEDCVLHLALYSRQVDLVLKLLDDRVLNPQRRIRLNHVNSNGNTILHEAATQDTCIRAARRIMALEPKLLTLLNHNGEPPVARAVRYGQFDMFRFLTQHPLSIFSDEDRVLNFYRINLGDRRHYNILHTAVYHQHFELALYIAQKFPSFVGEKDHDGMTALQLLAVNPSAFRFRNKQWLKYFITTSPSPIPRCTVPWWEGIRKECLRYEAAKDLARYLIETDTEWIHEREYNSSSTDNSPKDTEKKEKPPTPLMLAIKFGCLEIVDEILRLHPQTVEKVDPNYGSVLHVAIQHRQIEVLDKVEKMEMPMRRLVRKSDINGNSILHMVGENVVHNTNSSEDARTKKSLPATPWDVKETPKRSHPAFELQDDLLLFDRVEEILNTHYHKATNLRGQTAEQLFASNKEELRVTAQEWLKRTADNYTIVAVLIATVAFAAAYTVPGGSDKGAPVLIHQTFFVVFTVGDILSLTFALTSVVIFLSILTSSFQLLEFKKSLPQKLMTGITCLIFSVMMMMLAFAATVILMIQNQEQWTKITLYAVAFLPVTILALSYLPLYIRLLRTFDVTFNKLKSFLPRFSFH